MRSLVKIKPSQNGEIILLFTDVGKSCPSCEFLTSQTCLFTLFAKIKFSRKFSNLQYLLNWLEVKAQTSLHIHTVSTEPSLAHR